MHIRSQLLALILSQRISPDVIFARFVRWVINKKSYYKSKHRFAKFVVRCECTVQISMIFTDTEHSNMRKNKMWANNKLETLCYFLQLDKVLKENN